MKSPFKILFALIFKKSKSFSMKKVPILFCVVCIFSLIASCKRDTVEKELDQQLYEMAKNTDGFRWYKNSNALLDMSNGSGHSQPYLKTRYNSIAAKSLDNNGKINSNAVFEDGSVIVKELYSNTTTLYRYAVLYKKPDLPEADANGWVWGYINADGNVAVSAKEKGSACINCHLQSENIDYMLMNKYFP
jgi:hypothetical protein